ncbi:MAG: inositol monophosphatase [Bacteroidales bacterium]|nr:inositol monophosphatase [Bacteroidales bacterium]MBN2819023.1 inositol monophosphatase [Bacteroidales bacterium]
MNLEQTILNTVELSKEVGAMILAERAKFGGPRVETKGKNDFVTHVDKASEKDLIKGLSEILPGSGFIAEEGTTLEGKEEYKWIIDPIDGTTNFIHGAPPFCISIGLQHNNKVIAGVIYELTADECFYAWEGSPAFLNGKQIKVSENNLLKDSLLATGFPYTDFGRMEAFMETMDYFFHNSHGVRRLGSAAADLAYVACGRYDGFYEYNLNPWDVAAGAFLVEAAGGKISDFAGGDNYLFGKEIVASNSGIFNEFQGVINKIMKTN